MKLFLFIFESIGTPELLLIGIIALIFLGPRKMPGIARKLGKIMAEFRSTTNEFKATWEREVDFEREAEMLRTGEAPKESEPIPRTNSILPPASANNLSAPEIREIDPVTFEGVSPKTEEPPQPFPQPATEEKAADLNAKENWL